MILRSDKISLRQPEQGDLPYIQRLWADPGTMKEVGGPILIAGEQARRWFERMVNPGSDGDRYFLIINRENIPVGEASFHRFDPGTKTAQFNIKVGADHRGQGYGRAAAGLLLEYFFLDFGGEIMEDPIARDNTGGRQLMLGLGFLHDPSFTDVFMVRLTKTTYLANLQGRHK